MNDSELDQVLARFGSGYNTPPAKPPLEEIRGRVHSVNGAHRRRRYMAFTGIAAAAGLLLAVGLISGRRDQARERQATVTSADTGRSPQSLVIDERGQHAAMALASAIRSAERAAAANPSDPYFTEHLRAMRVNAEQFRELRARQQAGSI
jgi:hypothetical protein